MGRHVAGDMPALDRLVDDACAKIGGEIDTLCVPRLAGVVLGGGYGRGEGGALIKEEGKRKKEKGVMGSSNAECRLSNDLDFFAITEPGVSEAEVVPAIASALEPVSKKWTAELGVDVDFAVKTPWRLKHDEERLMVQELLRGYFDVAGRKGEELFAGIRRADAAELPWSEAVRLLMNRGIGLLFAKCKIESVKCKIGEVGEESGLSVAECRMAPERDFINRNINKCVLGAGDAKLIAQGAYRWRAEDRAAALGDALYSAAVDWKFRPKAEPVCDWETAREVWLAAENEVARSSRRSRGSSPSRPSSPRRRTLRNAVRWLVRRRTLGELSTFGLMPELRVLRRVSAAIRERRGISPSLRRDWEVFN